MKRFLLFFAAAFVILACSKDEEAIPVAPKSKFNLTIVATEGGSVSTTGGSYEEGSTVSVTATAASGYRFVEWSNGETTATINITVLGNITLTATFEKLAYSIEVSGAIAKGAFATGSTLTFYELTKALSQTGKTFNTDITDKYGSYSLSVEEVTEDYARVVGEGFYWNEVTNKTTSEKITLNALSEIKEGVNVNILTHLEYPRVEQLVKTEGKSFSDAKRQALIEVLSSLGIETTTDYGTAEQFNFVNGDDRSKILAVASVIIQAERSPAEVTAFITEVANDLKDNGSIDNTELKTEIAIPLAKIDLQKTATNLYNHYKEQNPELSAEDYISDYLETAKAEFQQYLPDADGDGVQDDLDQCPDTPSDEEADSNGCGKSQKAYQLTTNVEGSGSISEEIIVQPTASYDYGTTVRVTANPIVGWEFKEWKGDISSTEVSYDILIQEEVSVTAVFVRKQYGLDLTIEGEGSVSKNPDQSSYEYQSNVELTATPAEGWVFKEWRGDLPSATNPITVAFNSDKEMVAVFQRKTYDLNITISGEGAVAEEVITTPGRYEGGTAVELTATPANGWVFTGWSGDITSDQNPINITLTEEKNITATFTKKNFTLTTSKDGEGSVVVDPEKETYEFKTPIKITAAAADGWAFNKWTGDIESEENPLNIEIDDNLTVNAVFKRKQYDLTVTIEGEGTVEEEIVVAPTKYDYETQVKLTAVAKEGWEFASWGGDLQGTENPATITVTKGQSVTVTFTAIPGGIYLDSNGVTIKANVTAKVGERYILEDTGEEYLVVDEGRLKAMLIEGQDVGKVVTTKVTNLRYMFAYNTPYQGEIVGDISTWDVSNVLDMSYLFSDNSQFNQDISKWNVSSVVDMSRMFINATSFNQNIGQWDTSKVQTMNSMFLGASTFNQNIGNWNTASVKSMNSLFFGATEFNQPIGTWDTSKVQDMGQMFRGASSFNQEIGEWETSSVTSMYSMFLGATSFNKDIGGWDVSKVTTLTGMFWEATSFNKDISGWNVSNVVNMNGMFNKASSFNQPINNWDVSSVKNMQGLFAETIFNQDLGNWNVSKVEDMSWMFFNNTSFNQDISTWDVSQVKTFKQMFDRTTFNQDIGSWDVSGAESLSEMFWSNTEFNQDISDWNVSNVTNMYRMFQNASAFNQNIGAWDVSKVANMTEMFNNASNFSQNLSDWCVVNVTSEPNLFYEGSGIVNEQLPNWGQCPGVVGSIYLDDNGVTVKADEYASVGQTYVLEETGEEYLVVNEEMLRSMASDHSNNDLSKVVTTRVTRMTSLFLSQAEFNQDISSWDLSNTTYTTEMFRGAYSFNQDIGDWNVTNVINTHRMFMQASSFNQDISGWNVSKVTNMDGMFQEASVFNQDIGNWNVSNVTDMSGMFIGAALFNQDISSWNVSNVTDMRLMFSNAQSFNQPLNDWDVSNVTFMSWMFQNASSFNQPLEDWDVSNVISIRWMFGGASSFNQPIDNWDVSNVVGFSGMFSGATAFNKPVGKWNTSSAIDMEAMFQEAVLFNQNIGSWDTSSVNNMSEMFRGASNFNQNLSGWCVTNIPTKPTDFQTGSGLLDDQLPIWGICPGNGGGIYLDPNGVTVKANEFAIVGRKYTLEETGDEYLVVNEEVLRSMIDDDINQDLRMVVTTKVRDMSSLFVNQRLFNQDIGSWDVSNVTDMSQMFYGAYNFNQDISYWDVSNVENMNSMFSNASSFNQPINRWDTSRVNSMNGMFQNATLFNQPINNWNVSNVTNMAGMFKSASRFDQDISGWNISSVTTLSQMFREAVSFNQDIGNWNTSNVTLLTWMFSGASSFNQPIGNWNISMVENMKQMFDGARSFNKPLNNWDTSKVTSTAYMFRNADSFNQPIGDWNTSLVENMNGMFENASSFDQDLTKWCVYPSGITSNQEFANGSALRDINYPVWGTCPGEDTNDDDADGIPNYIDQCPGTTDDAFIDKNGCYEPRITCPLALTPGTWTVKMFDSYGDGWQTTTSEGGPGLQLYLNSTTVFKEFGLCSPYDESSYSCVNESYEATVTFEMPQGVEFIYWKWPGDSYGENSVEIYSPNGELFLTVNPGTQAKFLEVEGCQ